MSTTTNQERIMNDEVRLPPDEIAELRKLRGEGMTSAVGEYTPTEFWDALDEIERLRGLLHKARRVAVLCDSAVRARQRPEANSLEAQAHNLIAEIDAALSQPPAAPSAGQATGITAAELGYALKRATPAQVIEYLEDDANMRAALSIHFEEQHDQQPAPPSAPVGVGMYGRMYGHKPEALAQQPAIGEEIMVNAAHGVFTLPLQPSGLNGPRFVVHVPAPEQQPAAPSGEAVAAAVADALRLGIGVIRVEHVPHTEFAPPAQAVDLEQFREAVQYTLRRYEGVEGYPRGAARMRKLLALIDAQSQGEEAP